MSDVNDIPTLKMFDGHETAQAAADTETARGIEHVWVVCDPDYGMKEGEFILTSRDGMLMDDGEWHFAMLFRNPRVG